MLESPTSGKILVDGEDITAPNYPLSRLRHKMGMVFQNFNLFEHMTVLENIMFAPVKLLNLSEVRAQEEAMDLLKRVGMAQKADAYPSALSGGQMQRVAIARALVNNPAVILADEATGNLDTRTSFEMLVLFQKLHAMGRTIIFVTHNPDIARYSSRNIMLRDGKIREDVLNDNILSAEEALAQLPAPQDD
jgi:putative ABC transport system ATP-binding protein